MMTLGGSIKAGFSQETELNKKGRGGKKKERESSGQRDQYVQRS